MRAMIGSRVLLAAFVCSACLVLPAISVPALAWADGVQTYFSGGTCCGNRHYDGSNSNTTGNASSVSAGALVQPNNIACVQEVVNPGTPQSFYDGPACGFGSAYHSLNGRSVDKPLCWLQGPGNAFDCSQSYAIFY